jgi:predicted AAA+ superfamily ATPase
MYIKREVYKKLLQWKADKRHTTLEVNGARQVGKTFIIDKFAEDNFKHTTYINLFELSGSQFMACYKAATQWQPGQGARPKSPLHDALKMFDADFSDDEDTIVIIDEIQESAEVYNRIREFTRQFRCRFIVTGSYLGRIYEPEFRYSSGDVTKLQIYTLSFMEFLQAMDHSLYQEYLSQKDDQSEVMYERLKDIYDLYCRLGGYPSVVHTYIETGSIEDSRAELTRIINTFMDESIRYFTDVLDTQVFTDICLSICRILSREKKGLNEDSISEELQKLVTRDYSSNISKAVCNRAISWLRFSGIIGFCGKITEMDILDFKPGSRCYFMDLGLASYYMERVGALKSEIAGMLNENYVYINLKKRQDFPESIAFEMPAFATYKGGEIDFVVQSLDGSIRYAIEVKAGKNTGNTARKVLEAGKVHKLLYLKGNTKGGVDGKTETLPIYFLEQYRF